MPQKHPQCNPLARNHSLIPLGFIFMPLYDGLVMTSFRRHPSQKYSVSKKTNHATLTIWPANALYMMISLLNFCSAIESSKIVGVFRLGLTRYWDAMGERVKKLR
jgi:hypothetical protein